jgi:hypothetical protein
MVVKEMHGESFDEVRSLANTARLVETTAQCSCAISPRMCRHVLEVVHSEEKESSR